MASRTEAGFRMGGIAAVVGMALFVAACGSSNSSSSSSSSPAATAASSSSTPASSTSTTVAVGTTKGSMGTYLTGASGRAVYMWVADGSGKSSCAGECAKAWPPVIATSTPSVSGRALAADLGTITRSDGTTQVTYKGHPLYYFVGDPGSGTTKGQGNNGFGAKWWLVAPSGAGITATGSTAAASSSSSSSSSSGAAKSGGGWG